jgi:hypothetical protein
MTKIAISLSDEAARQLAQLAREAQLSEEALAREAIESLLLAHCGPPTPRFARRLGPLVTKGTAL